VSIPPHRRSVPLTLEQVQAQMPPQVETDNSPHGASLSSFWDPQDEEQEGSDEFGRVKRMLSAFGPALTRLTANQALNTMQGKPMLCWLHSNSGSELYSISNRYTLQERVRPLKEVTFKNNPETWPPQDRNSVTDMEIEPFFFFGEYQTPTALRNPGSRWDDPGPHQVYTSVADCMLRCELLRTTDSSCRAASKEEQQQFLQSTAASDAEDFDMFLHFARDAGRFYVFLQPTMHRFTGRLRDTAAPASGS